VPLGKVTFEGLTRWVSQLSLSGLGASAIQQSVFVMSAALDHAVRSGRIHSNPARGLGLPRPKRRDYIYLTHGQVLALASEAGRGRLLILLLAYTGLRWGEATALCVCDIDFGRRRVDVRRAFSDVGGRVILGTPKSHQSRAVPLPRFLADEMAAAAAGKHADQLVFTMPEGGVMRLTNWRRSVFLSARHRAGLSDRFRVLSRPGARCRDCSRPVSPSRSPNPPYRSLGHGLSTVSAVRRGWWSAMGMGSCCPGRCNGRPAPFRSGRTRPRPPRYATSRRGW
jgi:integrase